MCKLKSVLVLKDRVFCPDYDSHDDMLRELGIEDNLINAQKMFVRVELSPENGDPFIPVEEWNIKVDQDVRPDWFDDKADYPRVLETVKAWAEKHIVHGGEIEVSNGRYYVKNATVEAYGSATVTAWEYATVEAYGSATVTAYGSATVTAYDSATVEASGSATVIKTTFSSFSVDHLLLKDNATFIDHSQKTITNANYEFLKEIKK